MSAQHTPGIKRGFKDNIAAHECYGLAYDQVPKSVFAVVAFHLAHRLSGGECDPSEVLRREIEALAENGILRLPQAKKAAAAIKLAEGGA